MAVNPQDHTEMLRRLTALFIAIVGIFIATSAVAYDEVPPSAQDKGIHVHGDTHTDVRLLSEYEQVRPGDEFRVGIFFQLDEDWHIYWENPGDAGLPTQITWHGEGLEFSSLEWSAPGLYYEADGELTTFGYDGEVLLFSHARVADDAEGPIELSAHVEYLACRHECVSDDHRLSHTLSVGEESVAASKSIRKLFDDYAMQVPQRSEAVGIDTHAEKITEEEAVLQVILCADNDEDCPEMDVTYEEVEYAFVNTADSDVEVEVLSVESHPSASLGWELRLQILSEMPFEPAQLAGVMRLDDGHGSVVPIHVATPLANAPDFVELAAATAGDLSTDNPSPVGDDSSPSLIYVLLLAFLGGLILNLMPCVFPVLAIKVSSFTEMVQRDRSGILGNAAAYTGGITASMLVLGAVVVALRVGGTQVGWGFQFQQPLFLAALAVVIVLFALNTFDVYQVSLSSKSLAETTESSTGMRRSFAEGILAVVLATPCSAPFLGTAVGFALTANAATILLIFFVLGLGLASPFVVLTLIPGADRILPKPGAWMGYLKKFLGFALLAAAIWIVWLVGRVAGVNAMGQVLAILGAVSLAVWMFGQVQYRPWDRLKGLTVAASLFVVGITAMVFLPLDDSGAQLGATAGAEAAQEDGSITWLEWSYQTVEEQLADERAVFVNFTADWCLTCKANERNAIGTDRVRRAALANDVAMIKGDWTTPDDTIRAEIESFGKGGVPMYLFYPAGQNEPEVLPELLTPQMLVDRFEGEISE